MEHYFILYITPYPQVYTRGLSAAGQLLHPSVIIRDPAALAMTSAATAATNSSIKERQKVIAARSSCCWCSWKKQLMEATRPTRQEATRCWCAIISTSNHLQATSSLMAQPVHKLLKHGQVPEQEVHECWATLASASAATLLLIPMLGLARLCTVNRRYTVPMLV